MSNVHLDVWSGGGTRGNAPYVATDRFGRLRLSSATVAMFSAKGEVLRCYIGWDAANKRIALGKPGIVRPTDAVTLAFDKGRHYANIKAFMARHQLPLEARRFEYDGDYAGWRMFKLRDYDAPDGRGGR